MQKERPLWNPLASGLNLSQLSTVGIRRAAISALANAAIEAEYGLYIACALRCAIADTIPFRSGIPKRLPKHGLQSESNRQTSFLSGIPKRLPRVFTVMPGKANVPSSN